ncbi:rhodanese-like domain-containing protein [Paenibacillus allorhizosphaerae]|uniref:Thiosulfate sulfurtransferase GlpE n=1 Tax=Paenibacillus allorhizosphaerae TaxID=2849866 RepID=A0ABM8VGH9_9BACL|nr:rhodanese-like domain-containing protein [Paenibacillus allorhizosphaerae]CAG7638462.1 Thiosulfate sulfurtransferase GlpE [Paenibacillus allorhizosphaerae]
MAQIIENISHLDTQELLALSADPDRQAIFIDVREPEEYEAAHIPGIPLIPMGEIIDLIEQLDPDREYVFVCRSGRRSLEVAKFFSANGFEKIHNYLGGMLQWQQEAHKVAAGREHIIDAFTLEQLERKINL